MVYSIQFIDEYIYVNALGYFWSENLYFEIVTR